jgi:hypothetical protein
MSSVTLRKTSFGDYEVFGVDVYNEEEGVFLGNITNPDGHYFFEAFESSPLLHYKSLIDIAAELSRLNVGGSNE